MKFIWNSAQEVCLFSVYLLIHLYQYGLRNICFMFGVVIYDFILFSICSSLGHCSSFQLAPVLDIPSPFFLDKGTSLCSDAGKMFMTHLVYFLTQSYEQTFLQGALVHFIRVGFRKQDLGTVCAHYFWGYH